MDNEQNEIQINGVGNSLDGVKPLPLEGDNKIPEPLSGQETARVIAEIYQLLGPENGCLLVAPNAVLAIAGIKGDADLAYGVINDSLKTRIETANRELEAKGFRLSYPRNVSISGATGTSFVITNLKGLDYKTGRTKLPGFSHYDSSTGFRGLFAWWRDVYAKIAQAKEAGTIAQSVNTNIYEEGVALGYPDQAIIDFERCFREGDIYNDLIEADILSVNPNCRLYAGAQPVYDYYPQSANDPEIVENIRLSRKILDDFYKNEWFQRIIKDPSFLAARESQNQRHMARLKELGIKQ